MVGAQGGGTGLGISAAADSGVLLPGGMDLRAAFHSALRHT